MKHQPMRTQVHGTPVLAPLKPTVQQQGSGVAIDHASALILQDFSSGTFFNRVIDDGKASDNTRHLSHHPKTGEPFLLPPMDIRRVLLVQPCGRFLYFDTDRICCERPARYGPRGA